MILLDLVLRKILTRSQDIDPFIPVMRERALQEQIQQLICYLWDNYLQLHETNEIFLLGVGNAYLGVKVLLLNRGKMFRDCLFPSFTKETCLILSECMSKLSGIVNFVTGNLRPVKSDIFPELSSWYKENSRVYVASDHACWSDHDLIKKVQKRRFGSVVRSPELGLNKMMWKHADEAQAWMLSRTSAASIGDTTEDEDGDSHEMRNVRSG